MGVLLIIYILAVMSALGGCVEAWGFVIPGTIVLIYILSVKNKADNYDYKKVNTGRMWKDKSENKLSDFEVQQNMINGKYDWKPGDVDRYTGEKH